MKKLVLSTISILAFIVFSSFGNAQVFMTTYSNGTEQKSFLSNETMYVVANNITNSSVSINLYLINHNSSIPNQVVIIGQILGPITLTTNSSGGFDTRLFWSPNLIPGTYDLIADVNKNSIYDSGTCGAGADCLYSAGGSGISVVRAPIPVLTFSAGPQSPGSRSYTYDSNSPNAIILQSKVVGDQVEPIIINTFDFVPSGTGNDRNGISIVKLYDDSNGNGVVDQGEPLLGYGQYLSDDGVLRIDVSSSPFKIQPNATVYLLLQYTMTNSISSGQTFSTQFISVTASGQNTLQKAVLKNLPMNSGTLTIAGGGSSSTTSSTTTTTTTTTLPKDQCSKDSDCGSSSCSNGNQVTPQCKAGSNGVKVCSSATSTVICCPGEKCGGGFDLNILLLVVAAAVAFMVPAIYFFFIKKPTSRPELYRGP